MQNRSRWYAELAGTILLWVEEVPDHPNNPPFGWRGTVLRRSLVLALDGPEDQRIVRFTPDEFYEKFLETAKAGAVQGVTNSPSKFINAYGGRIGEIEWREWAGSDQDWENWKDRFMDSGQTE